MITLGIHDGHTATAAIVKDGRVLACISEERLNRIKEWGGFPTQAIQQCISVAGIDTAEIEGVGIVGLMPPSIPQDYQTLSLPKRIFNYGATVAPRSFMQSTAWTGWAQNIGGKLRKRHEIQAKLRDLGITAPTTFYEHHYLHAATASYFSWFGSDKKLVITCDGSGDAICASVNIGEGGHLTRIAEISTYNSLGEFYTQVTKHLGMKPMSHEYKVMGLAPYAKSDQIEKTLTVFNKYFSIDSSAVPVFRNTSGSWVWHYPKRLLKDLAGHRFDSIAGAAQEILEQTLVEWIRQCIIYTGISKVCLAGGVFLNVKANNLLLNLPELDDLFVFPSCGDESLAMSAALVKGLEDNNNQFSDLGHIYLGPEFSETQIERALTNTSGYNVKRVSDINTLVGTELARDRVIARFSGRMEFGARSLGNRSILANPQNRNVVMLINEAIKNRDFWMPFAPSILEERSTDYIINPKGFFAPYMIMAFPTTAKGSSDLAAATHPYDATVRPQVLRQEWNPGYYNVLKTFERETGIGGILNTSLNLHGEPIVCSPEDALSTFERSQLDGLALGDYFISRHED